MSSEEFGLINVDWTISTTESLNNQYNNNTPLDNQINYDPFSTHQIHENEQLQQNTMM